MLSLTYTAGSRASGANFRILLVDDEPSVLRGLARALRALRPGWNVSVATSGVVALQHLAEQACDVLVTDLEMPGVDGVTLLGRVYHEHPQVVRLVHSSRTEDDGAAFGQLAQGALEKPAQPNALVGMIERALAMRAA